ncbi:protein of unknown function DUF423 [Planctopirus limnophila DSM 3776]|uniref:DUF423 domain-containing protein n=1 Tax=Planctopirus limnophila (strain ATCC 43296 / DSM 3776 / IFAM 1008 / Mu 290) TaxID=521674 RepID=D5SP24_PLAL2|nr:DUF423 domain-containing protein [Planctopirus limnophila]ADG66179.1 protein of unknown function DUF423 [Planctopirus limnophila DSM 3776]
MKPQWWLIIGAMICGTSVGTGAFAAHSLTDHFAVVYAGQTREVAGEVIPLARKYLQDFKTGAEYQMFHGLALLAVGIWALVKQQSGQTASRLLNWAGWMFLVGVILFSGSLYTLTLSGVRVLGAVTPLGGVAFLAGWAFLAVAAFADQRSSITEKSAAS